MALNILNKLDLRIVYRHLRAKFGVSGSHNCRDLCVDTDKQTDRRSVIAFLTIYKYRMV